MNLDQFADFSQLDPQNMLGHIDSLPAQLDAAWELGQALPLPEWQDIHRIVIAGMGGSAIGADLLSAYVFPNCPIPLYVHRDYGLPGWAQGTHTLAITLSHSGNTEETLNCYEHAAANGCLCLSLTTGGKLVKLAQAYGTTLWTFEHPGQPRSAVGYTFGLLLAALCRLKLVPAQEDLVQGAVKAMRAQQAFLRADVPVVRNPAKRLAGQLMGRWVAVFGSGILAPVARRWKSQLNEIAKAWAQFELLPEADHNTLSGTIYPEGQLSRLETIFLRSLSDHSRNRMRSDLTRSSFMQDGLATDVIEALGLTPLDHLWTILHFGDYVAYYLAIAYDMDPTPVPALEMLKQELGKIPWT